MTNAVSDNPERRRYELTVEGSIAFIDYHRVGKLRVLTHTEVPAAVRGRGVGAQLTAGALARAGQFTEEQIATAVGVERCIINAERYQQATGTTKQEIIGSNVLLFTSIDSDGPMDASNLVRHVANAAYGGGEYAVYITDIGVKLIALTVENYEYLHVQHTTGIQQIQVN